MNFSFLRRGIAALTMVALAACAGQGGAVPSAATSADNGGSSIGPLTYHSPLASMLLQPNNKNCDVSSSFWYFRGGCTIFDLSSKPTTVVLTTYRGFEIQIIFPRSNSQSNPFLLADGTSDKDITGTFEGSKFPKYGSIPCETTSGSSHSCFGHSFIFVLIINGGSSSVSFTEFPEFIVTFSRPPGTRCELNLLESTSGGGFVFVLLPVFATVSGDRLVFKPYRTHFTFGHDQFLIFGFSCE